MKNCGARCCQFFEIKIKEDPDTIRYFRLHGLDVSDTGIIHFEFPCTKLKEDGSCGIYEERPELCKLFPRPGDPVPNTCIYKKKKKVSLANPSKKKKVTLKK